MAESTVRVRFSFGEVAAGVTLLGSLGIVLAWLAGPWSTYADAFSHLLGHAIGGLVGSLIAIIWRRRALLILSTAVLLTLGFHTTLTWRATSEDVIPRGPGELKLVSLNTWHANEDLERLLNYLRREDADIVLVYEFGPNKLKLIDQLKEQYPYAAGCAETWHCSVEVFSKRPYTSAEAGRRELFDGPPRVAATFGEGAHSLTIVGAHIMRPIDGPNGHRMEMRRVAGIARAAPGAVIVAGDFNATWWSYSFRMFHEESGLTHMGRFMPSWPSESRGWPQLNIDHLWASKDIIIENVHLGPDMGSDHRPLVAILRLPDGLTW